MTWIQASSLKELLDLKAQHPEAKLVVGNTEIGKWLPGAPSSWFNPFLAVLSCPSFH